MGLSWLSKLKGPMRKGLLFKNDVNLALVDLLTIQMRLGMLDGERSAQPFGKLGPQDVCTPAH